MEPLMLIDYEQDIDLTTHEQVHVPLQPSSEPASCDRVDAKLVVMLPGAFHTGKTFAPLQTVLEKAGVETMAVTLETENLEATSETDAVQVAEAIGDRTGVVVFAWSRGVETLVRLPRHLKNGQLEGAIVMGSGGPHEYLLPSEQETQSANPRYNKEYRTGMVPVKDKSGLYLYDSKAARHFFYHDLPYDSAAEALEQMVPQRQFVPDVPLAPWDPELPTLLLLGRSDRVLEVARARAVGRRYFHANTEMIVGGHSLHISQAEVLGNRILQFIDDDLPLKDTIRLT